MDTNYVQEFLVLKEAGSFLKAADILGITQPTLSRHIQAIESEIGKQLFKRDRHSFQITEAGQAFTLYATTLMEAQKNLILDFENTYAVNRSFFHVGMVHGSEHYGIFDMLKAFHQEEPDVRLNIYNEFGSTLIHDLRHGVCDVIFLWDLGGPSPEHRSIPFTKDVFVLHIPYGHRLFGKKTVQLSELAGEEIYIRCAPHLRMFHLIMQKCYDAGTKINLSPFLGYWMSASDNALYMTLRKQTDRIRHSGQFSIAGIEPALELKMEIRYKTNNRNGTAIKFIDYVSRSIN